MELGPSTIIGVGLAMVGILLYALRLREPHASRGVISDVLSVEFQHIYNKLLIWNLEEKIERMKS